MGRTPAAPGFEALAQGLGHLNQPGRRDERGSATIFVIGFALVLFLCAGLVIDGGLAINKRMRVADDAEQTARIGADSIDPNVLRKTNEVHIDKALAEQRMSGYMSDLGYSKDQWNAQVGADDTVHVFVHDVSKTFILSLFDVTFPVQAEADAVPDTGDLPATGTQPAAPTPDAPQPDTPQPDNGQPDTGGQTAP